MVALVTPCSPSTTRRLLERFAFQGSTPALIRRELSHLTSRELDVLRLLARGLSNAEIAEQLALSEATVKTHVARLLAKLQIRDWGTWLYRQNQTREPAFLTRPAPIAGPGDQTSRDLCPGVPDPDHLGAAPNTGGRPYSRSRSAPCGASQIPSHTL